jgi:hypothetical protein
MIELLKFWTFGEFMSLTAEMTVRADPVIGPLVLDTSFASNFSPKDPGNLFFGTGLCSTKEMSVGLPFEVLSYIVVAARLQQVLGRDKIIHILGDANARTVFPEADIDGKTKEIVRLIMLVVKNLGLTNYQVILASDHLADPTYVSITADLSVRAPPDMNDYVKLQLADMEWVRRQGATVKLSWSMDGKVARHDERFFDAAYSSLFGQGVMSFIYVPPGKTLGGRPNVCPYSCPADEADKRVLLKRIRRSLQPQIDDLRSNSATRKYLSLLVHAIESIFPIRASSAAAAEASLGHRIEQIVDHVVKE